MDVSHLLSCSELIGALVETAGVEPATSGCRPDVFPLALRPQILVADKRIELFAESL